MHLGRAGAVGHAVLWRSLQFIHLFRQSVKSLQWNGWLGRRWGWDASFLPSYCSVLVGGIVGGAGQVDNSDKNKN